MAYIEKDEALAIIENRQREICPNGRYSRNDLCGSDREAFDNWQEILDEIKAIPSADVAPVRHGHWIKTGSYAFGENEYLCSECKETEWRSSASRLRYCPFCGSMMDGGAD